MKQQVTITNYFKSKSRPGKEMEGSSKKKHNLSLIKTPTKSPKTHKDERLEVYYVDSNDSLSSSNSTVIYSPGSRTPQTSYSVTQSLKRTPISCPAIVQTYGSPNFGTPSKDTFYSPTRKRSCAVKSPIKAKRNLNHLLSYSTTSIYDSNDFLTICEGLNDKTIFLLKIIYQFLHDETLKPLLEEKSINLLTNVLRVNKPGMHLVCRLYWRQDKWQRKDSIEKILSDKKTVINHTTAEVLKSLVEYNLLTVSNLSNQKLDIEFDDLVKILKLDELKAVCKELNIKNKKSKEEIIESLRNFQSQKTNITNYLLGGKSKNETRLLNVLCGKVGVCYKLSEEARNTLKELYILMYLGIKENILREKGLELMLINDKAGKETYPIDKNMELDNANVVFKNRQEFKSYIDARDIREEFLEETNVATKCMIVRKVFDLYKTIDEEKMGSYMLLPPWLHRFTPPNIYIKVLEEGIKDLKKDKIAENITLAVDILSTLITQNLWRQHKKADWYAEKALILDKLMGKSEEAALLLLEGFRSNMNELNKDVLRPRALVLAKRQTNAISATSKTQLLEFANKEDIQEKNFKATHVYKQPMESSTKGKKQFMTRTATGRSVCEAEERCIQHYIEEQGLYTHGEHWEGKIVTAIFFLLFWDIIYSKLRGVNGIFLSYYQKFPLDMFTESFYTNRKTLIDARLKEIMSFTVEELLAEMKSVWDSRPEHEISPINGMCWARVRGAGAALRAGGAAALCARAAVAGAAGFPDLTLWHERTGEIAFVEVKTDSDRPSLRQLQWMHYLRSRGLHVEFCYIGVRTDRQLARARADADWGNTPNDS